MLMVELARYVFDTGTDRVIPDHCPRTVTAPNRPQCDCTCHTYSASRNIEDTQPAGDRVH